MASIDSTSPPLVAKGSKSPAQLDSPSRLRSSGGKLTADVTQLVAKDLENLRDAVNRTHGTLQTTQSLSQLFIRNNAGQIVAAVGDLIFDGVHYTNYFSEIHVGDPNLTGDPSQSLFNANTDGTVTVGKNGQVFVLDPFSSIGAWIGTQSETAKAVTGAANNGAGLIRLLIIGHGWISGDEVNVAGVGGVPNATGQWVIVVFDADHIDLTGSTFAGAYTSGGTAQRYFTGGLFSTMAVGGAKRVTNVVNNGAGLCRVTIAAHGYQTGYAVVLTGIQGVPGVNSKSWTVTVINANAFDLIGSTFSGAYAGGGSSLNWPTAKLIARADGSLTINDASITLNSNGITTKISNAAVVDIDGTPASSLVSIDNATGVLSYIDPFEFVANNAAGRTVVKIANRSGGKVGVYSGSGVVGHNGFMEMQGGIGFTLTAFSGGFAGSHLSILDFTSLDFSQTSGSSDAASYGQTSASITDGVTTVTLTAGSVDAPVLSCGYASFTGSLAAPSSPGVGFAFLYYDTTIGALRYSLGGAGWVDIAASAASGGAGEIQLSDGSGGFTSSASFVFDTGLTQLSVPWLVVGNFGITVASGGLVASLGDVNVVAGNFVCQGGTGFTGTLAAAIAAAKNVIGGIIVN